ncbi:glutathione synthase/RimK-type ligase-like ATP-grasp enzyme [Tumebacillus sp. BK434]|uniref:YheC/YheD family endospore coat-associated protein n=1 Tax=Tumebacillus sp. BK434 TaxID=2512169 RepID=UPI001043FAD0|nr:YheC/YheD family protein [Tumebacillus sp. BK434]TCP52747.1 glutathione synthase/RimK-type ligase-like ATP-grasp enzyme [Tumebacillus sp. BK434]
MKPDLLGLMTTDLPAPASRQSLSPTWLLLAEEGRAAGWPVLFFHPHQVSLASNTVRGYLLGANGAWRHGTAALPQVVVDQVFVHVARTDARYATVKRGLIQKGARVVNPRLPDKRGVWRTLLQSAALRPHLPESSALHSADDVESWLQRHPSVFVKPVRGSKGRGVVRITRAADGRYAVAEGKEQVLGTAAMRKMIARRLGREKHLIQQGLPLVEADGSKIDLRVVLYRDDSKRWRPVATVPRVGQSGQAVTNLAQGGRTESLAWLQEELRSQCLPVPAREQIEQVAVLTAEALTPLRPSLAFLGIDIGLTTDGGLYALDINPRPGRQVLSMDDRRNAYQYLIGYCKTLL